MRNDPINLLEPVFHWRNGLIHENGDYLYMVLVYVSLPLIAWIFSGGSLRRLRQQPGIAAVPIVVIWPNAVPSPWPPGVAGDYRPPADDDSQSFAE